MRSPYLTTIHHTPKEWRSNLLVKLYIEDHLTMVDLSMDLSKLLKPGPEQLLNHAVWKEEIRDWAMCRALPVYSVLHDFEYLLRWFEEVSRHYVVQGWSIVEILITKANTVLIIYEQNTTRNKDHRWLAWFRSSLQD